MFVLFCFFNTFLIILSNEFTFFPFKEHCTQAKCLFLLHLEIKTDFSTGGKLKKVINFSAGNEHNSAVGSIAINKSQRSQDFFISI